MVLAFIKKILCVGLLLFFGFNICYAQDGDNISINGFNLTLENGFLIYKHKDLTKKLNLGLSGEVKFIKNQSGMPQIEQTKWGTVVAVASSKIIPKSNDCETIIKGIVIKNSRIYISPKVQNIAMCGYGPKDSLMFIDFAYTLYDQMNK